MKVGTYVKTKGPHFGFICVGQVITGVIPGIHVRIFEGWPGSVGTVQYFSDEELEELSALERLARL